MTSAEQMANDLFIDEFGTCMDKSVEELRIDLKSYSDLTMNQGQIRLLPGIKRNIQAFIQFARDEMRQGRDPQNVAFDPGTTGILLRRYATHKRFMEKSKHYWIQQNLGFSLAQQNGKIGVHRF